MKKPEIFRQTVRIRAVAQISRFIATAFAAIAVCLAWNAHAVNILSNPGFDGPPAGLSSWSAHSTEGWSYAPNTQLILSAPDCLWMQGLYLNGGAPNTYISYVYQKLASAPGYTYTADAWFSQFVQQPYSSREGGGDTNAGDLYIGTPSGVWSCSLFGNNDYPAYSPNSAGAGYYEDGWVEVQFLSSSGTILADYKSGIINPALVHNLATTGAVTTNGASVNLNWFDVPVTNQYNPTTIVANGDPDPGNTAPGATLSPGPTNSIPSGVMTAPPGTVYVQFSLNLCQSGFASGASHWDNCTLNQLTGLQPAAINNLTPNGGTVFNIASTNFTFNVVSGVGTSVASNNIQVIENGVDVSKNLQFSGSSSNWIVKVPGLASNTLYAFTINVENSANLISSTGTRFDTFDPNDFIVPAEDYDFNGGQFIQNPTPSTNAGPSTYFGTIGTDLIDYHLYSGGVPGGGLNLIPNYPDRNTNTAWQIPSDPQLPSYIALGAPTSGVYNVTIAYNNAGNWFNYTRNPYPTGGYYQIYARMSYGNGPNGGSETLQLLTSGAGTTNQVSTNLGYFVINAAVPGWNDDWGTYFWVPLGSDASGLNPTVVNLPTGQQTLQIISGLGCNLTYFVFVPIPALGLPPVIKNFNPPILTAGQNIFVSTNTVTFTISSLISTVPTNNIHTYINGVSVPETFTGSSSNWAVSVPLNAVANQPNVTFSVSAVDNNGLSNGVTGTFDTFSQTNFMFEAEDFDFNSGQFIDNPVPTSGYVTNGNLGANSYFYYAGGSAGNVSTPGVDLSTSNDVAGETFAYRINDSCGTEITTDFLRNKFVIAGVTNVDFDVGWWVPGTWLNYTRTIPTNSYLVYGRLAAAGAYSNATMALVTSGRGTPSQATTPLGTFSDLNASGFQSWHWVPLLAANGQPAVVPLGGVETLKVTAPPVPAGIGGVLNANFYMFVPYTAVSPFSASASVSAGTVSIKFPSQSTHSYTVQYSTSLNPANWQTLSGASNLAGTGGTITVTDSTTGGAVRFYRVAAN